MSEPMMTAAPGWVIIEDLGIPEEQSSGGIVLPSCGEDKQMYLLREGLVLSAGPYVTRRGEIPFGTKEWLLPGTIVMWTPQHPWTLVTGARKLVTIHSDDVIGFVAQKE